MDIGFIGLGNMGFHMARRLVEAGHRLTVYDTRPEAIERLTKLGASAGHLAARPRRHRSRPWWRACPRPTSCSRSRPATDGVIEGKRIRRFVDTSTTGARMAAHIFDLLKAKNIVQIDSPVSGGVSGAEKGTLAVMASGPRAEVDAVEPALKVFGKVFFIGERPGAGQTMKLTNNVLSATAMAATSEAIVMGVKAGLDPRVMVDVINASTGRNTATETKFPRNIIPRKFDLGFTNGLMMKDVKLCLAEAEALGVPMEVIRAVAGLLQNACDEIGPEKDLTTIVQPVERRAGVEVKAPTP